LTLIVKGKLERDGRVEGIVVVEEEDEVIRKKKKKEGRRLDVGLLMVL
jgi:hypothetical protein